LGLPENKEEKHMAKYSSKDLDLSVGGQSMKAHIRDDVTLSIEVATEEATAFGDTWEKHVSTGIKKGGTVTVGGFYDDTATTGPDVKFNVLGTELAIIVTWGGSKTSTFTAIAQKYDRIAKVKEMTKYLATLLITGEVQEA
jgi:hypothetical protein